MRQNDYRRKGEGKKVRFRRLPSPDEMKMGSKTFEDENDDDYKIIQCPTCENWVEESELDDLNICPYCPDYKVDKESNNE